MKITRVLMVEDNLAQIDIMRDILTFINPSLTLIAHTSGEAALEWLNNDEPLPQLALVDLGLPGINGIEFINRMKSVKKFEAIPVVIITGMALDIIKGHDTNAVFGYIIKPIKSDEFKGLLSKLGFDL